MKYLSLIPALLLSASAYTQDPLGTLSLAKLTGACGIMDAQLSFQESTQLPGGDEFVARFWNTEATRLGMSMQEFSDTCDRALAGYNTLWEALQ